MFQSVFFRRLFLPYLVLICAAIGGVGFFAGLRLRETHLETRRQSLHADLQLATDLIHDDLTARRLDALDREIKRMGEEVQCRFTVIAPDGTVLADSWKNPREMENHSNRPEVIQASGNGEATSVRHSDTIKDGLLYVARRLPENLGYLRIAVRVSDVDRELWLLYGTLSAAALAAMVLSGGICYHFARRLSRPIVELTNLADAIAHGDLDQRTVASGKGEIATLGTALNQMADSIRDLLNQARKDKLELLTILTSMGEGVIATDRQQNIVVVNGAAAELLAFEADAAQGKPLWQVVRIDRVIKAAAEVIAGGDQRMLEIGLIAGRHVEITVCPIPSQDPQSGPAGLVVVIHDTTQSVRYQELRKEFVANVSHELRTPLTVIKGFVETLQDGALGDPVRGPKYLSTIERHTNQLTNLVNDLLELSKLESQPDLPRRVSVDLAATVRKAIELLTPQAQKKHQSLTQDIQRVPIIAGNPDYLERAVANLIDNAVKYTPDGGRIGVSLKPNGLGAVIEVSDNGIGIPAADIPRIFERFYRVDRSRSREMGGTGLGLSIVKHIAQAHGGTVEVTSTPGEGSTFRLKLPTVEEARWRMEGTGPQAA